MKEIRRLDAPREGGLFERGRTSAVRSFDITREEFERVQRDRPELIAAEEAGVMLLLPAGKVAPLYYGFESIDALRQRFRPMLEKLTVALKPGESPAGLLLRFTDQPNRGYIEPVLEESLFELKREWMRMTLAQLPEELPPGDEIAPGFLLRPSTPDDYEALNEVGSEAFGWRNLFPFDAAEFAAQADEQLVLVERESGRLVGHLGLFRCEERTGEMRVLAIHPDYRRRGLGEAVMRWGLAWMRQQGLRRAKLTVFVDNSAAIALYRKLGFAPGQIGLTYRRPTDKKELAKMVENRTGTYIKFGGWR